MNKSLIIIGILILSALFISGVLFFVVNKKIEVLAPAQIDAPIVNENQNYIIENLDNVNVLKEFSDQNFPDKTEIKKLISDISKKCDWKKRKGGLIDSYTTKNIDGEDQIAYIYEFKLKCDQFNFIITYNMGKGEPELFRFDFEPLTE